MLKALQAKYSSVMALVRMADGTTSSELSCRVGLEQGERSSSILFSFLINELAQQDQIYNLS